MRAGSIKRVDRRLQVYGQRDMIKSTWWMVTDLGRPSGISGVWQGCIRLLVGWSLTTPVSLSLSPSLVLCSRCWASQAHPSSPATTAKAASSASGAPGGSEILAQRTSSQTTSTARWRRVRAGATRSSSRSGPASAAAATAATAATASAAAPHASSPACGAAWSATARWTAMAWCRSSGPAPTSDGSCLRWK